MKDFTDEQLAIYARRGDSSALDIILRRLKPLVKSKAKAYYVTSGDPEDLIQEGMIGLYKAVLNFDEKKGIAFTAFASLCIVRQIQTAVKTAARQKHIPLNTSVSLNNETADLESLRSADNPEELFLGSEALKDMDDFIRKNLSPLEYDVLMLHMDGKTYAQISEALGKTSKSVDNTLQRIRRKIGDNISGRNR